MPTGVPNPKPDVPVAKTRNSTRLGGTLARYLETHPWVLEVMRAYISSPTIGIDRAVQQAGAGQHINSARQLSKDYGWSTWRPVLNKLLDERKREYRLEAHRHVQAQIAAERRFLTTGAKVGGSRDDLLFLESEIIETRAQIRDAVTGKAKNDLMDYLERIEKKLESTSKQAPREKTRTEAEEKVFQELEAREAKKRADMAAGAGMLKPELLERRDAS